MATGGIKFEEFDGKDIECYLERLEQRFIAMGLDGNDAEKAQKRRGILISSIGGEH